MNDSNTRQQLRYLEEISISLHRVGFEIKSLEDCELSILWNNAPLCRITGKGSVFYRREDVSTPPAGWKAITAYLLTSTARCWRGRIVNTASNSLHGIGTMTAQAYPTGTTAWRTMTGPNRTSPHRPVLSTRSSFSARSR